MDEFKQWLKKFDSDSDGRISVEEPAGHKGQRRVVLQDEGQARREDGGQEFERRDR